MTEPVRGRELLPGVLAEPVAPVPDELEALAGHMEAPGAEAVTSFDGPSADRRLPIGTVMVSEASGGCRRRARTRPYAALASEVVAVDAV